MHICTKETIEKFLIHQDFAKYANIRSQDDKLYSYLTCIAFWKNGVVYYTSKKYSVTTSTQQSALRLLISQNNIQSEELDFDHVHPYMD